MLGGARTSLSPAHRQPIAINCRPRPVSSQVVAPVFSLSIAVLLFSLGAWGIGLAATGRTLERPYVTATLLVEAELVIQAIAAAAILVGGHRPNSLPEFIGYLVTSIILIPFALERARGIEQTRWEPAIVGAVCIALAVAVLRLLSLW